MFLPLGAHWSMDAARHSGWSTSVLVSCACRRGAPFAVGFIYAFNALFKTGAAWTTDFTASKWLSEARRGLARGASGFSSTQSC